MTTTRKDRPRDPVQLGKLIVDIATGQTLDAEDDRKNALETEVGKKEPLTSRVTINRRVVVGTS